QVPANDSPVRPLTASPRSSTSLLTRSPRGFRILAARTRRHANGCSCLYRWPVIRSTGRRRGGGRSSGRATKDPRAGCETCRRRGEKFRILLEDPRSEEHTSELQSRFDLVCRLLLEKKKKTT